MEKLLEAAKGRTIKEITPIYTEKDEELWVFEIKFEDDSQLNIYMCENAGRYLDIDLKVDGKYI